MAFDNSNTAHSRTKPSQRPSADFVPSSMDPMFKSDDAQPTSGMYRTGAWRRPYRSGQRIRSAKMQPLTSNTFTQLGRRMWRTNPDGSLDLARTFVLAGLAALIGIMLFLCLNSPEKNRALRAAMTQRVHSLGHVVHVKKAAKVHQVAMKR